MSAAHKKIKHDRPLNIFVSYELKQALEELAERHDRTLTNVVRTLLTMAIPVVNAVWEAEGRLLQESAGLFRRSPTPKKLDD